MKSEKSQQKLIESIEKIINNYKNPSAYMGILDKKKADSFRKDFKKQ
jgi:hypothetical protein